MANTRLQGAGSLDNLTPLGGMGSIGSIGGLGRVGYGSPAPAMRPEVHVTGYGDVDQSMLSNPLVRQGASMGINELLKGTDASGIGGPLMSLSQGSPWGMAEWGANKIADAGNLSTALQYGTDFGSEQTAMLAAQDMGLEGGLSSAAPYLSAAFKLARGDAGGAVGTALGSAIGGPIGGMIGGFIGSSLF